MISLMYQKITSDMDKLPSKQTKQIRSLGKSYKKDLKDWPIEEVYQLCELLLRENTWNTTTLAYQIIDTQRLKYTEQTFDVFNHWVQTYIRDWWDCDDFLTHAFAYYFLQYPHKLKNIKQWTTNEHFGVRRSAAVALIVPARKHAIDFTQIIEICDFLHTDEHYLVLKGYGWLLKEASIQYHDEVIQYVRTHVHTMPRTAYRYAIEKLPEKERQELMSL